MPSPSNQRDFEPVPMRIHPRVFAALGADLVTNDIVAVVELVKNAYDALAHNVWLRFNSSTTDDTYLEIEDDGCGMTRETIENAWCCVATPYKKERPTITNASLQRRVTGDKGLGRLAVARLGSRLTLLTKASGEPCWEVDINWSDLAGAVDLSNTFAHCRKYTESRCFDTSGTLLRILGMTSEWNRHRIADLRENLARLISPFSEVGDFDIYLSHSLTDSPQDVRIESPKFLSSPKYSIKGSADSHGNVKATYRGASISTPELVEKDVTLSWEQIFDVIQDKNRFQYCHDKAHCGQFEFEIRAWDLDSEGVQEISRSFALQKSDVRKAIRAHKGISIYRDRVLVLPKSENSRDWLGLDLRRVSRVGTRLSTSQIVGSVFISQRNNPKIDDTSDRERLVSCLEVAEFEEILKAIIGRLEIERGVNRSQPLRRQEPLLQLFERLSTKELTSKVHAVSREGTKRSEILPVIREFGVSLQQIRRDIERYFVYYSHLATVGTIAQMLVHEIRNRTTAVGTFHRSVMDRFGPFNDPDMAEDFRYAEDAINSLERLADTFGPLASRSFRRRKRHSIVEHRIRSCLHLYRSDIKRRHITCDVPDSKTTVAVDPGELDAVILNLISNSLYWMTTTRKDDRLLQFCISVDSKDDSRAQVSIRDSGSGISQDDLERVFLPGMTKKPGGIGMGLTVASELVALYAGRITAESPDSHSGAMIVFDLPLAPNHQN